MAEQEMNPQKLPERAGQDAEALTPDDSNTNAQTAAPASDAPVEVLSAKRKMALLWYLGVLFLIAFAIVAISLAVQMRNSRTTISELSQNNSSALANVEKLQEQNRALQAEAQEQVQTIAQQQEAISDLNEQLAKKDEAIETLQTRLDALRKDLEDSSMIDEKTIRVYEALVTALTCQTHEGNVTYSRAIETVESGKELLSERALAVYESLINE